MKTTNQTTETTLQDLIKDKVFAVFKKSSLDIDFQYFLQDEEFTTLEEIEDILNNQNAFDTEIIYYSRAIEFLRENDPSLRNSLDIAGELGYTPENLNSEILATLLASQINREGFAELRNDIESAIQEAEEEHEEQENSLTDEL
jgi:hypothetical protein